MAEGIEDRATLDLLASMDCDYAQGYFIGRPVGFEEFSALIGAPQRDLRKIA